MTRRLLLAAALAALLGGCTGAEAASSDPGPPAATATSASASTTGAGTPGGLISFATETRGQVALIRPDGSGRVERVAQNGSPTALSPDGRTVMYATVTPQGTDGIGLIGTDGTGRRDLPLPEGWNVVPGVWAPDSRTVAGARWGVRPGSGGVYLVGTDGAGGRMLTHPTGLDYDFPLAWSPDGRWIAFMRVPDTETPAFMGVLYVVAADGRSSEWRMSPKGTSVRHFYVAPASFFPDSSRIAFVASHGLDGPWDDNGMIGRLIVADLGTRELTDVTGWRHWTLTTHVSPDGQWLAFDQLPGTGNFHRLYVVRPDGSDLHLVPGSPSSSVSPIWSPDGRHLLTAVDGQEANNLAVVAVDGSEPVVELTRSGGEIYLFYDWVQPR